MTKQKIREAKQSYKKLPREEKRSYMQKLIDLKKAQKEEKLRRVSELKKDVLACNLVRIKTDV